MNISVMMTYSRYLLLAGAMCAFASCQREDLPSDETGNGKAIEISASSEWPKFTKGLITDPDDLAGDGFVVWGAWKKDPADKTTYIGDYSSGANNSVFGENGTMVNYVDGSEWEYNPKKYWNRGTYTFAAVLPGSKFAATYNSSGSGANYIAGLNVPATGNPSMEISFGEGGFNLNANQTDIMVAFTDVDNRTEADATVALSFVHQLTLVKFEASATDATVEVDEIILKSYKIKAESAEFTWSNNTITSVWDLKDETGNSSHKNGGNSWVMTTDIQSMFEHLVLPQTATGVKVSITYTEHFDGASTEAEKAVTKNIEVAIPEITWQPSKIYTYRFMVTAEGIKFDTPIIDDWKNGSDNVFDIPEM